MKVGFISLGCAKNQVNCEQMIWKTYEAGYEVALGAEDCDVAVVNTCGFLQEAREEALAEIDALAQAKAQRENRVELQKIKQGYQVTCHISGGDMDLMAVTLYVPDRAQAEMVKRSFYKDPAGVYKLVLASLTKDTSLAREYFIERQEQL